MSKKKPQQSQKKNQKKSPNLPPVDGGAARQKQQSRRAEMAELMAERKRAERRRTVLTQVGIGAVVVALVVGVTIAVLANRGPDEPAAAPSRLTSDGSVRFGAADADVTVQVVEDFQCPACGAFEAAMGDVLADYRASDDVAVEYRPIAFLDRASTDEYSTRALNASMCVLEDAGADAWMTMHESLFAQQPAEGGAGLDDATLVALAADAGAEGDAVTSCIEDRTYDDWAEEQTDRVFDSGVSSTPTVLVNGEQVPNGELEAAVEAARS
ncbi:thioredoxin domain-containing protein [Nocardioides sp. IC4_145]|uniref:DsbA family protein n=1 Tax=Nocardioides sp. IC4_145 TaxID=2714037 RepID=UPI00140A26A8|nr:thioredoxin domain-containing protein [Nocardioides sp. IC4_145]NHC22761.1 thioredoxin domain-containing protein [Nocardioides sp. IC4_145]